MATYQIYKRKVFGIFSTNTALILVNVTAFIFFSILISYNTGLLDYIALKPSNILEGRFLWTFLTSMFMHGGFIHLLVNMFSMFFVGSLVERILGPKRYLYFYIMAGLAAGIFFVLLAFIFGADLGTYAVGASGALFGLIGLLTLLTPNLPVYIMFIPIPIRMKYAAPGLLILLWLISIAGNVPIGNTAHLGGLVAGIAYGIYLRKKYRKKTNYIKDHFS
jgi:membrane associated rhomboid family serine protease